MLIRRNSWTKVFVLGMTLILLAVSVTPAEAGEKVFLTIRNVTQSSVTLRLKGPTDLVLNIENRNTKILIEAGNYTYRYFACGVWRTGDINVNRDGVVLRLGKCEKGVNSTLKISNFTGKAFELQLHGPQTYFLTIATGSHRYTVLAGQYEFMAITCGNLLASEKRLGPQGLAEWVWSCVP
jgi:hypothetical protein